MKLYAGEQPFAKEELVTLDEVVASVLAMSGDGVLVIGVDGRSGGGKTTFAKALAEKLGASLLSTDDFAWWHSLFDWPEMLIENAVVPLRAGKAIDFKPPAWVDREREGSIVAPASKYVIVEGIGSTQPAMRNHLDVRIWVQTDADVARERGLLRDLAERPDPAEAERFWNEWQVAEDEFQAKAQSWLVADFVVSGQA